MRISIALCTYNGRAYLSDQLESFLRQTRLPDELIVCDDGSVDGTPDIVRDFAQRAPFGVSLFENADNLGSTKNFEQAIQRCSGDVIFLSDQDDVWLPEKIERMEALFAADEKLALVFSNATVVDNRLHSLNDDLWAAKQFSPQLQARIQAGDAISVLLKQNYVTGATMAFRASYRPLVLPVSPLWVHDAWIALAVALFAPIKPIRENLILYRQHADNQIGGTRPGVRQRLSMARHAHRERLLLTAQRYTAFLEHIQKLEFVPEREQICALLKAKINHVEARARLPQMRMTRIPLIVRELVAGRYQRFSLGGFLAAVRDALA